MNNQIFQHRLLENFTNYQNNSAIEYKNHIITYGELDQKSNYIANWIISKGMKREAFIGIIMRDRVQFIVTMIGILKAGCVFVPLDPALPASKLDMMMDTVNMEMIIGDELHENAAKAFTLIEEKSIELAVIHDLFRDKQRSWFLPVPGIQYSHEDKIYIYFTSGTTGKPKAILGKNKSLTHFIDWEIETFVKNENFRFSQFITPGFDASLRDIFVPLCSGGVICIPDEDTMSDPIKIVEWIDKSQINLIHCVPSFFRFLKSNPLTGDNFQSLKFILLSGEKINPPDIESWYAVFDERIQLVNFYGPTETTMIKTYYFINKKDVNQERIPIGKPMKGARVIIFDKDMKVCDELVTGELYIRTPYRTFGYYNDPLLNREKFIPNPFTNNPDDLLYKTGDWGRLLPDGNIDLFGRIDRQVKIRGIRIELEEIETILAKHPDLNEAVVIKVEISENNELLGAFVTGTENPQTPGEQSSTDYLMEYLSGKLPDYMIPSKIIKIEKIPRKPNGKVDYEILSNLFTRKITDYIPPRDDIQRKLSELWSEILGVEKIGINHNFIELGGNSLSIMSLIAKVHKVFDVRISLGEIFTNNTIEMQAAIIKEAKKDEYYSIEVVGKKEYYATSHAQKRVWVLSQSEDASLTFNIPSSFMVEGELDRDILEKALTQLIQRHESLRTVFINLDGVPGQKILKTGETGFHLDYLDLKNVEDSESQARELVDAQNDIPFDLSRGPLWRVKLVELAEKKWVFHFTMHHIISDALSSNVLLRELVNLYISFREGQGNPLTPLRIQYKDYAAWHNEKLKQEEAHQHRQYWLRLLERLPQLRLPTDRDRPSITAYDGDSVFFQLDEIFTGKLRTMARNNDVTLFMLLLAILSTFFYKYTDQMEFILGIPASGREHHDLEAQIGFYINTLPFRTYFRSADTFLTLLKKTKGLSVEAFEHQLYPFDLLVQDLQIKRESGKHPVFDVVMDMINYIPSQTRMEESRLEVEVWGVRVNKSKFDLAIYFFEGEDSIGVRFEYRTDLFERRTINGMTRRLRNLINSILEAPGQPITHLVMEETPRFPPIKSTTDGMSLVPASYHQERLWFIDEFEAGNLYESSPIYHNIPLILKFRGPLDVKKLEQSIRQVLNRHSILRTRVITVDNIPFQQIQETLNFKLACDSVPRDRALNLALEESKRPFLLDKEPPVRAKLFQISSEEFLLVITLHHIIADKYSLEIFTREMCHYYMAGPGSHIPQLPALPVQYADFSQWQRQWPEEIEDTLLFYWKRKLQGKLQPLELPTTHPRAMVHTFRAGQQSFTLQGALCEKIMSLAKQEELEVRAILLAAFKILLYRYSNQEEVVVGTSSENRDQPAAANIIGPIANLLVLRSFFNGSFTPHRSLAQMVKVLNHAHKYRDMPFDKLVSELNPQKDMSRTALFDVVFRCEENPPQPPEVNGLEMNVVETNLGWGKYDLDLLIRKETGENLFTGIMVYNREYYDDALIIRMLNHYKTLLEGFLENIHQPISTIPLLTAVEKHQLLNQWNQTSTAYPADKTIHQLFQEQVATAPDYTAVVHEERVLTYQVLNRQANRIAACLRDQFKCRPHDLLAVLLNKSEVLISVLLGILKIGAAYVPIDPNYPLNRTAFILADSGIKGVITDEQAREKPDNQFKGAIIDIDSFPPGPGNEPVDNDDPPLVNQVDDTAYVIYTSGTTGKPKGCMVSHRNVVRLLKNDKFPFDFQYQDVWIMAHSYCFDFSVWEMYGALLYGGRLIVPRQEDVRDLYRWLSIIKQYQISVLNQTPPAFYTLISLEKDAHQNKLHHHLRQVIFGGDRLEPGYLKEWTNRYPLNSIQLVNMYGITETTVHVTYHLLTHSDIHGNGSISPIGKPLPETTVYILSPGLTLQPPEVTGEMYVGGTGVARGYLNRPELTAEKFISCEFNRAYMSYRTNTIYKTGDLGRWRGDGSIEFKGRIDHQVKIRGFRIELEEIENHLLNYGSIKKAVVIARDTSAAGVDPQDQGSGKHLCAYIIPDKAPDIPGLREYLTGRLPDYMIPSYFTVLAQIPLTANGKIDRKKLPAPEPEVANDSYIIPRDNREETLAHIWSDILGLDSSKIGIDFDFFEWGGHSISATILTARIHKEFDVKIPLTKLFLTPTIRELANYIKVTTKTRFVSIRAAEEKEYYASSSAQKRLYIVHEMDRENLSYNVPTILNLEGELKIEKLSKIFRKLIRRHESFRTSFRLVKEQPVQIIPGEVEFSMEIVNAAADPGEIHQIVKNFMRPFDLAKAPLLRAELIRQTETKHILMVERHHIISDFISDELMVRDFVALYRGEELFPLKLQYKDYSEWQNRQLYREEIKEQEKYWLKVFEGEIPELKLPIDYEKPAVKSNKGKGINFMIDHQLSVELRTLTKETTTTLYMVLLTVFNILLSRYTKQEDIIVGSPITGRNHADLENIFVVFVNMMALRNRPERHKTFREFLAEVKENTLKAFENEDYQFDELVSQLGLKKNTGENPLSEVVFNMISPEENKAPLEYADGTGRLQVSPYHFEDDRTPFNLLLVARDDDNDIYIAFIYATTLFKRDTIEKMAAHFIDILKQVMENREIQLADITMSHDLLAVKPASDRSGEAVFHF